MKTKGIKLPGSNLYLLSNSYDINGNRCLKFKFDIGAAFSIQSGGNLQKSERILRGLKTYKDMGAVSTEDLKVISKEVCSFIKEFGSKLAKERLEEYRNLER